MIAACLLLNPAGAVADYGTQFDGFIQPLHDAQVAFVETGVLTQLHVKIGDRVSAGQVLATLDDEMQRSHVRIAEAHVEKRGELHAASAEHALHQQRLAKLRLLHEDRMAQLEELRRAEADSEIAVGRYLAAKEDLTLRKLELERARLQLERRELKAPFDGIVTGLLRQVGEYVPPNDPALLRLISDEHMVAVVNLPAELLPQCKTGAMVRVRTTAPPASFQATIESVSPAIDGESGTVRVRAVFANPQARCRAGDRCTITFVPDRLKSAGATASDAGVQR